MTRAPLLALATLLTLTAGCDSDKDTPDGETGQVDTAEPTPVDGDGDGYDVDEDCDDANPDVHPGAAETCNDRDDDCDGELDEGLSTATWYRDADGDGYGDALDPVDDCAAPEGYVADDTDCDDTDDAIHPGATETWYDGTDQDCAGDDDDDQDGDGFVLADDCDDADGEVNPDASETCDGVDDDCDGAVDTVDRAQLHFDGDDDMIMVGDDDRLDITDAITMEAWVRSETPGADEPVMAKENSGGRQQYWFGVFYDHFGLLLGDGSGWGLDARASGTIVADTWTHIASVWDGDTWRNYQDGVLVDSGAYDTPIVTGDQPLTLAINSGYDYTAFQGDIYDVRLYAAARTGAQIRRDMYGNVDTTDLVGWWMLDEASGQVAADGSGNGLDGQLGDTGGADDRDPTWDRRVVGCQTWYADGDGDGYGDASATTEDLTPPAGYVADDSDCDDGDDAIHPDAFEVCDELDDDCDGDVDESGGISLDLDGAGDHVTIGDDGLLDITSAITMEAWVRAGTPGSDEPILAKENSGGRQQYWFGVYHDAFGLLLGDGGGWGLNQRASGTVVADTWTHLASVWDGSTWRNYQDGALVGSGSYSTPMVTGTQPLTIGINSGYDNTAFDGNLYDVRLFDVARTQAQIQANMYGLTDTTGLIGWWLLDDASGQVAADSSGNGLDGQLGSDSGSDDRDPTWIDAGPGCF